MEMPGNHSNLLNRDVSEAKFDKSIIKVVVLAFFSLAFSFVFGYFLKSFFAGGNLNHLLFSCLAAAGFAAFFFLESLFTKNFWLASLVNLLNIAAFSANFYEFLASQIFLAGIAISLLVLVWGDYGGRRELQNMLKIKLWRIGKKTVPKAVLAIALLAGTVYYLQAAGAGPTDEFFISRTTFQKIVSPAVSLGLIQKFFPGFDPSLSAEKIMENFAQKQAEGNSQFNSLPESAKKQVLSQSVKELEDTIAKFGGGKFNTSGNFYDTLYDLAVYKFSQLSAAGKQAVPAVAAVSIFLSIILLIWPIRMAVMTIAFVFYEMFLAFGFIEVTTEGKEKEIVVLK
jgi:hypothetical protein